jgi:hypothetical protein
MDLGLNYTINVLFFIALELAKEKTTMLFHEWRSENYKFSWYN